MFICIDTDVKTTSEWTDLEGGRATGLGGVSGHTCTVNKSKTKGHEDGDGAHL